VESAPVRTLCPRLPRRDRLVDPYAAQPVKRESADGMDA